ncbi:MAG: tRNA dihydrouridine synthase [Salinispira sp.]
MLHSRSTLQSFWHKLPRPITILAPMESVTDLVFRDMVHRMGRPMVYMTEFIQAKALLKCEREAMRRLGFNETQRPIVAQIWGNNPQDYFEAAQAIHRRGFDGIDINMGCPVRKITAKGACSALINNSQLAAELIIAAREGAVAAFTKYGNDHEGPENRIQQDVPLPVSVKTRTGFKKLQTEEWCGFLLTQGIQLLTIHGRTAIQQSEGMADWQEIKRAVALRNEIAPETLLVGNGDITEFSQFDEYSKHYGVDGIMVGKGIFNNPFIFRNAYFHELSPAEHIAWAWLHLKNYRAAYKGRRNFEIMKKFFKIYLRNFDGADQLCEQIMAAHDYDEAEQLLSFHASGYGVKNLLAVL